LKPDADLNMLATLRTLATFQPPMFWLNAEAKENIPCILATLATFHPPMLTLKADADSNKAEKSVMEAVFQEAMF
jgi:hypothetical protein